jgi:hypothetical protein
MIWNCDPMCVGSSVWRTMWLPTWLSLACAHFRHKPSARRPPKRSRGILMLPAGLRRAPSTRLRRRDQEFEIAQHPATTSTATWLEDAIPTIAVPSSLVTIACDDKTAGIARWESTPPRCRREMDMGDVSRSRERQHRRSTPATQSNRGARRTIAESFRRWPAVAGGAVR